MRHLPFSSLQTRQRTVLPNGPLTNLPVKQQQQNWPCGSLKVPGGFVDAPGLLVSLSHCHCQH